MATFALIVVVALFCFVILYGSIKVGNYYPEDKK
jgi:hypothetical protein